MKRINFLIALLLLSLSISAQSSEITGVVSEGGTNSPLIGVTISVKGKQLATSTNQEGQYAIQASQGEELVFTYMGMVDVTRTVGSARVINVQMNEDNIALEQVVVIGYGTVKKSDLTGAVGSISAKDLQADVATNAVSALQGRMAGVSVTSQTGQPGSGMNINVRGITSMSHTSPLYVIDGVYGDINMIDPSDVQSIEVLKDAAAAAIYGSRAANGVVLVTTKTGRKNTPSKLSVNFFTGIQQLPEKISVMNGEQWAQFVNKNNIGGQSNYAFSGQGTNWQDEIYRSAPIFKGSMNISGGGETSTYSASVGYTSQEGIMINTGYEAINVRLKNDFSFINNRLKIGESIIFKTAKQDRAPNSNLVRQALTMPSTIPVYDAKRKTGWGAVDSWMTNHANPLGSIVVNDNMQETQQRSNEVLFNGYLSFEFIDGLSYKANLGLTRNNSEGYGTKGIFDFGSGGQNAVPDKTESRNSRNNWLLENTLNYDKSIDKHNIYALVGYAAEGTSRKSISASMDDVPLGISSMNGGGKSTGGSRYYRGSTVSMFGRLMYSFDSRYLLSASIRRDGSSKFAHGYRWGSFPSVSLGWNIHNEKFAESLKSSFVDELKLRASYGKLGNKEIDDYATQRTATSGINYVENEGPWRGTMPGVTWVSPEYLTWESSETTNIGLDATFLKGKLGLTAEVYVAKNKDILMKVPMAGNSGLKDSPYMNAGTFENRGVELSLNHRNQVGDLFYSLSGNVTFLNNKMKEINVSTMREIGGYNPNGLGMVSRARIGNSVSGFYLVKSDGLFRSEAEIDAHANAKGERIQPKAKPGDLRLVDYNGDGQISSDDVQYMGTGIPKTSFGFRANFEWKSFDLGMFFDGVMGNKLYNDPRFRIETARVIMNYSPALLNSWTMDNQNTNVPRYDKDATWNNAANTDRWLEKGDFLRMKTLEFGYTFPRSLVGKAKLEKVRIYTSFENLFTITAYKGYTPDLGAGDHYGGGGADPTSIGVDFGRYPTPRIMSLGVQINL